jgi:F-type H+-transporting ATPase subunit delta
MPSKRFIHVGPVEETYAQALLELSEEAGQLNDIAAEMADLAALAQSDTDLLRLLGNRVLAVHERAQAIERVFRGRVSDLLYRFLMVANTKSRLDLLPGIARAFVLLVEKKLGIVEVEAYVPTDMGTDQSRRMEAELGQVLGRHVILHVHVDPTLLGGIKVRVGDQLIDGTVAAQLRLARERLMDSGRERARQQAVAL